MNLSILVADDNEMNRWLLAEQLQRWTNAISLAKDGGEAWALLQQNRYSLIFLDINMPGFNGYELAKKARTESINRLTPIIAITAHIQPTHHPSMMDDGFNGYLIKPIVLEDLRCVINRWCLDQPISNANYYAETILKKTEHNRALSRMFLQNLFQDTPSQMASLEQALRNQQCQQACDIAHKLHGSFCFYGFEDFRSLAQDLEQSLLDNDLSKATLKFDSLNAKFTVLQNMQPNLLTLLSE